MTLTNEIGWPFLASLPVAFLAAAVVSVAFERVLYRRLYRATDLDQCLLTIGIVFISVAVAAYVYGTIQQPLNVPAYLRGTVSVMPRCSTRPRASTRRGALHARTRSATTTGYGAYYAARMTASS